MQLRNDVDGRNALRETIYGYYKKNGDRPSVNFRDSEEDGFFYTYFLFDRKHVIRYSLGEDRHVCIGGLCLAIGPHYFRPSEFWDYENDRRFSMEASPEAVVRNLKLLDEFFGVLPPQKDLQPIS